MLYGYARLCVPPEPKRCFGRGPAARADRAELRRAIGKLEKGDVLMAPRQIRRYHHALDEVRIMI